MQRADTGTVSTPAMSEKIGVCAAASLLWMLSRTPACHSNVRRLGIAGPTASPRGPTHSPPCLQVASTALPQVLRAFPLLLWHPPLRTLTQIIPLTGGAAGVDGAAAGAVRLPLAAVAPAAELPAGGTVGRGGRPDGCGQRGRQPRLHRAAPGAQISKFSFMFVFMAAEAACMDAGGAGNGFASTALRRVRGRQHRQRNWVTKQAPECKSRPALPHAGLLLTSGDWLELPRSLVW